MRRPTWECCARKTTTRNTKSTISPKVSKVGQFDLGMPPHGGIAIGLERLTAQILNLPNIRRATLYPRDRTKLTL
jgi:lysyl-tRNA synthetase class II